MKELILHVDHIKYEAKSKTKLAEEGRKLHEKDQMEDALFVAIAVEKEDEANLKAITLKAINDLKDISKKVKTNNIMLYPYVHLLFGSKPASPKFAISLLKNIEQELKKRKFKIKRAPFGFYKSFSLTVKGHPLSELSREFSVEGKIEEKYDYKKLLKEVSKSKLDTTKLKPNDHRVLGQQMDLFSFNETAPGMVFWHDKGLIIYNELIKFWREEHRKEGYQEISTPFVLDKKLWQISGHWEKYRENIFLTKYENRDFAVKPMNCPGGMLVYKIRPRSYKELPLRVGEMGVVHRHELSGVLAGLFRVIQITQDDAHIYCMEEQLESETIKVMGMIDRFYRKVFNFNYDVELSTRPKKRIGTKAMWDKAEKILKTVLKKKKIKYKINKGDGAFYGPKIDFHIKDSLKRTWQLATIQLDFSMPERFDLVYEGKDGKKHRPVMLHRVIYGALERFIGILLEHTSGRLPLWLAPIQVCVLSFTKKNVKAAKKLFEDFKKEGIRVDLNLEESPIAGRVRNSEIQKIPYIIVIGDKEEKTKTLAIRSNNKIKFGIKKDPFVKKIKKEILERK